MIVQNRYMTGDRLARLSLRVDAIYCIVLGLLIAVTAPIASSGEAVPPALLIAVGGMTFLWGVYVWRASDQRPIRTSTRFVMAANIAASLALATTGLVAGPTVLAFAAFVLAIDVGAFAVSQGVALRRLKGSTAV